MERIHNGNSHHQIDPLLHHSSLSLFPRSFTSLSHPDFSTAAGSVYSHLRAMVLRSPENVLKQAKTVIHDSLNLFKNDKTSEDKTNDAFVTSEKNPQVKRRPALGLEKAKFSTKSMSRQMDTATELSIDIDKLEDPQKFFEAYERTKNAKKEMRKLRGEALKQLDHNLFSLPPRSRRPSLLGTSATYRPQSYTSMATDDNERMLLSSEAFVNSTVSPVRQNVRSETDDVAMLSVTKVHDSPTSEFDKLLSCDYDALDATQVVNLLHEKLDVKVHKFNKLSIPDLREVGPPKSVSSIEPFSKITHPSSHINGIRKAIIGSQSNESKAQLPKSPLASISMLNRHISKLASSVDPFSANDIDSSPDKNTEVGQTGQSMRKSKGRMDGSNVGQLDGMESRVDLFEIVEHSERFDDRVVVRDEDPIYEDKEKQNEVVKDVDPSHVELENFEKFTVNEVEGCVSGEASITMDILSKKPTKVSSQTSPANESGKKSKVSSQTSPANERVNKEMEANTPSNGSKKRKQIDDPPPTRKKIVNRRSSLFGVGGTKWEAGVRRSSRIRMRPLEYWRGERFIYGRVHESLVTVIGVKYASPSKEAERKIKVKCLVSDEHKDKVESAALY